MFVHVASLNPSLVSCELVTVSSLQVSYGVPPFFFFSSFVDANKGTALIYGVIKVSPINGNGAKFGRVYH